MVWYAHYNTRLITNAMQTEKPNPIPEIAKHEMLLRVN